MVRARSILLVLIVAVLAMTLTAVVCTAQESDEPTVTETYQVTINDVGDGHVVDTIKYSKDDYALIKKVEGEKRGFLTRRFNDEDDKGELIDFNTDLDDSKHSVVITYDKPGMAYSTKGDFVFYGGFSSKPKASAGNKYTFEETSTVNSEFTLFSDQVFKTTTEVTLPRSASGITYDSEDNALKYQMPPARTLYGFWSEQRVVLSIVFGLLTLVFAGLLAFVATRKPAEAVAPPYPSSPARAPEPSAQGAAVPSGGEAAGNEHGFCPHCGGRLVKGKKFCTGCGAPVH